MKNLIIIFLLIILINSYNIPSCYANANKTQSAEISKIENDLYGFDYLNDEINNRVSRLEKTIYGQAKNGDLSSRIKKLAEDITSGQIGLEIPPVEDTFNEENEVADNTVDYPIVDEIEMKLFGQTYKNRDFHTRIVTIERKLFGKIYDVDDYSTRMDRIKTEIMPETLATDPNRFDYNNNGINSSDLSGITTDRFSTRMPFGQRNYTRPYTNYGNYNSYSYNDLEDDTFGTEFSNDDIKTRVKRLKSAKKAQKSKSRYDSQKFQQRMSTAMEIGAMILMILAMVL